MPSRPPRVFQSALLGPPPPPGGGGGGGEGKGIVRLANAHESNRRVHRAAKRLHTKCSSASRCSSANCIRLLEPLSESFVEIFARCDSTVRGLMKSSEAISFVVFLCAMAFRI